jgi:hypothetical protein
MNYRNHVSCQDVGGKVTSLIILGSAHFSELCLRYVFYVILWFGRSKMRLLAKTDLSGNKFI